MPKKDGNLGEKIVDSYLTFYDMGGKNGNTVSTYAGKICFVPKNEGEQIGITFDNLDLGGVAALYVYDGDVTFNSYSAAVPENPLAKLSGQISGQTFQSTKGKLSVLYHCKGSGSGTGWVATVKSFVPKEMVFLGLEASRTGIADAYPGKKAQPLLAVNVKTEGSLNALPLNKLSFDLNGTTSLGDLTNLRVYYTGSSRTFAPNNLFGEPVATAIQTIQAEGIQNLGSGDNYFWLVADVSADAVPDNKLTASCTSVYVNQEEKVTAPLTAEGTVNIENKILMSATPMTYKVGENPTDFYDDGGKEGTISENFNGKVIFEPSTIGKKVCIDFTKVVLFESSNKNEILKVYNGKEAIAANLIQQVKSGETILIRSTSPDGALTVTLNCDTGYPKDGFEATVSQFTPQAMTVSEIIPAQFTEGTVCAGDMNQPILSFNTRTQQTEPALTASRFSFTTGETFSKLSKATLYYTKRNANFATTIKLGETEITADAFEITAETPAGLTEGNNYFWLAYDLKADVQNGDKIDAGLTGVTLSDGKHAVADGNPEGDRTVRNEYISQLGEYEKTILGTWGYKSKPNPNTAYNGYEPVAGEQTVTFTPSTPGMIVELEFSDFQVYYSSSSYGVKAKFAVYSGKGTTGEKLWELTSADDSNKGPGYILRSRSADGALTVVFDANTSTSSYTAKGWTAEVREYKPRPMVVSKIDAFQASTEILKAGAVNQEIIGFSIQTDGDQAPLTLNGIIVNLKGCQDKAGKVSLYTSGRDSILVKENPLAEAVPATDNGNLNLALNQPVALQEGKTYYWITYDISQDVKAGQVIDAALASVKIGTENKTPENGDPEGDRIVKNTYDLQAGENGTVTVGSEPLMFYDNGGANGQTPKNFKGTITFAPKEAGQVIKLTFKEWSISGNDKMLIYYGGEKKDKEDVKYSNTSKVGTLVSKSEDGKLTVYFECPSYGYASDGWAIEVSSYTLQDLSLGNVKTTVVAPSKLLKGMNDVPMLRVDVEINGDKGTLDISQLSFNPMNTTDGTVSNATVYCTDTIGSFIAQDKFAESLQAVPYTFNGSYQATEAGIYKFWLAYDLSSEAAVYDKAEAKLTAITAAGIKTQPTDPVIASATVAEGFSGSYTIGEEGDYKTIAAAIDAMKEGIDAPVVFELESGEYNELVEIPEIPGASAVNTITFKSQSGKYQDVKIYHDRYSEPSYSDDKMFHEYGVFTVAGVSYLTLDGVSVTTTDLTFPSVIHIKNASRHVTVKNCHIYAGMTTNYSNDINLVYQYAQSLANRNNDYFTLENCLLEGGYNGIRVGGTTVVALPKQRGSKILNNTLRNQGAKGIYIPGEAELSIAGNIITNTETDKTDFNAMDVTAYEGLSISGNMINLATKNYASGIYLRSANGTTGQPGYVVNNEVSVTCAGGSASSGIKLTSPSTNLNVVYNTVRMKGSTAGSAALHLNDVMKETSVRNNILQNEANGYVYRLYKNTCLEGTVYSNNMVYGSQENLFARIGSDEMGRDAWNTQSGESDSYAGQTMFLSDNVLEPAEAGELNHAMPLESVSSDLNGTVRSKENPTIGAYEFSDSSHAPALEEGYPVISGIRHNEASVTIKSSLSGKAFVLVRKSGETAPAAEEVKAGLSLDIRKGKETTTILEHLDYQTDYICYIVLQNLKNMDSEVLKSELFTTSYLPTEVSTFENVVPTSESGFEDGTAAFTGFTVVEITDGVGTGNAKAARIDGTGTVTLTNSTKGIKLTGFYLKSDAEVTLKATDAQPADTEKRIASTEGKWIFCNLKDMGKIVSLTFTTSGQDACIDNFSGEPQPITFGLENLNAREGEEATLSTTVSGGVAPYSYLWKNAKGEELATTASYTFTPVHTGEYRLVVTDAWNASAVRKALVTVEGKGYTATFDDLYLEPDKHWRGDEETGGNTKFYSGSYAFDNNYTKEYSSWSGFAYSSERTGSTNAEFRAVPGSGAGESANYGVAYVYAQPTLTVTNKAEGDSISGCYITNTAWVEDAILNGDGMSTVAGGFAKGDYFTMTAKGLDKDGKVTSEAVYYLADYRPENSADCYYLDTWQWFDLRGLGKVRNVTFSLESTKKNSYGMTTPAYFCVDDFNGERVIAEKTAPTLELGETNLKLSQFFTFDDADATIAYSLDEPFENDRISVTLDEDQLKIDAKEDKASGFVLVKAVQKGKIRFARIGLTVEHNYGSIGSNSAAQVALYPVPARDRLTIDTELENYSVEITSVNGMNVFMQTDNYGRTTISVSQLENGVYILKLSDGKQTVMRRFTKVNQ